MLKTEQARTARYTSRVDKPVDRTISVGNKRKPQYLEVALAQGSNNLNLKESKDGNKNSKGKNVKLEKEDLGIKRGRNKVNVFTGKNVNNSDQKLSTVGSKTSRQQPSGTEALTEKSLTFKEKLRFENDKNQRLYQELDEMLAGKHGMPFPTEPKGEPTGPVKITKQDLATGREPVTVVTKQSLYPGISKEARERHSDNLSFRESNVLPRSFLGEQSEILHKRELQAEARLEKLENIDRFTIGDFTVKPQGPSSHLSNRTQTVSVGIPVHGGNPVSRRHIVADIPVYLPTHAGGNQPVQPVVKETGPVPVDEVYKNTVPGSLGKPFQPGIHPTTHAPEAFVGPVPGLDTVIAETQGGPPALNTYRVTGNPISERLLKEKEENEQSVLENKYFDVDPESEQKGRTQHPYIRSIEESDKNKLRTLISDPGPRVQDSTVVEKPRLSPEGYLAQKARKERLEKEVKSLKTGERKEAFVTLERAGQSSSKAVPKFDNQYQLDFYAQRTRSEIRLGMNLDREDSWIKRQLEKPSRSPVAMDTYRGHGSTYRTGGYRNEPQRGGEDTYRAGGQLTYRGDGETAYRSNEPDRYSNRSYNLPENIRGRDRYSDHGGDRYSDHMARGPGQVGNRDYDPRYERERKDFNRERDSRRDFDERSRRERDYRNSDIERDRRDFERIGKYERSPLSSMYEPEKERERFNDNLRDTKPNTGKDNYGRQTYDKSRGKDEKVQYVLKNKSENSRNELRKSDMSERSEALPESIPPSSTELVARDRSPKTRQTPLGQEKSKGSMNEYRETVGRLPTYETKTESKAGGKSADDLNKYFDDPERQESPVSVMPHYTEGNDTYTRPKHDFRNGEMMTPVQELSIKQSEDDDGQMSKTDKGSAGSKPTNSSDKNDRVKFLSSNSNKHEIAEDRRSPWRRADDDDDRGRSASLREEPPRHIERHTDSPDITKSKGSDSIQQMRERIREKTLEKIKEKREERKREKTIDSQGPTDNRDDIKTDEIDIDDLNLDDVVTEMDEKELYVCYLVTDNGEKIGPMRLDINDVQIGLPNPDKVKDIPEQTGEIENEGMRNRQTGSHGLNEFSSRSHSMLMLTIDSEMQDPEDENLYITKRGKLTFVDLAGSEKVKDSNSTADTLVESNSINKSLLVLGNCISSLGDQKRRQGHIPYRDSKLTKLLADSLGGNGVTLMICCITPSSYHAPETMNTLRYASRAKKIRTKPVIKMDPREKLILSLKREIKVLRNENHYLRQQLEFPAKPKSQLQKENDQKMIKLMKETNGKPDTNNTVSNNDDKAKQSGNGADESGLYEMLQEYMVENEALRTENAEMQVNRDKVRQDQQLLYRDNEKLMKRVDELERRLNQATTSWQSMPRQDSHRSRDHSPRNSPQYRGGGSGGKVMQAKFAQPPNELRDIPALRDPIYPGSPPQGYHSPTSNGRPKPGQGQQPPPQRGQPLKPPHRLADPIQQQRQPYEQNGPPYMNGNPGGHPAGHGYPAGHPAMQPGPGHHPGAGNQYRQPHIGSPNRPNDLRMDSRKSSTSSSSDAIRDMNEKLKQELAQLDGQIHNHQAYNQHKNMYGSQGSMR